MKKLKQIIIIITMSFYLIASAQIDKAKQIDDLLRYCNNYEMFNGVALVSLDGQIIFKNAFGYANYATKTKNSLKSQFNLASVSKQFTGMGIMILREQEKLSYDDKITTYFQGLPSVLNQITIRHLLNHTSGLPDHFQHGNLEDGFTNQDVLKYVKSQTSLEFQPNDKYSYSNTNYVLLALIIEKVSGKSYGSFLNETIFNPLKMKHTLVYDKSKPKIKRRVTGYNSKREIRDYESNSYGDGGIYSTIEDLYKWHKALYTDKLVSKSSMNEAHSMVKLNDKSFSNYGFGVGIKDTGEIKFANHTGSYGGFLTYLKRGLNSKFSYILLTNHGDAFPVREVNAAIWNIINDQPYLRPKVKISKVLNKYLETQPLSVALTNTRQKIEEHPNYYVLDEMPIGQLGQQYLNKGDLESAKQVFEFNNKINSTSYRTHENMGAILLKLKDSSNAINHYKKSIELNPNNSKLKDVMQSLGVSVDNDNTDITVSMETLKAYIGKYQRPGTPFILEITLEGNALFATPIGQPKQQLYPSSEVRFYSKRAPVQITFHKKGKGEKVMEATVHFDGDQLIKRIEN